MKYVEIIAKGSSTDTILKIASRAKYQDARLGLEGEDGMRSFRLLVGEDRLQGMIDDLQHVLGAQPTAKIVVMPIEAIVPEPEERERAREDAATTAREALYEEMERNVRLNASFLVLVVLSTLVAAIGLIEDNVPVIIGGMVIAPLLAPNLGLSLGTALGNGLLIRQATLTLLVGLLVPVILGSFVGLFWPEEISSQALSRLTDAGLDSVVLALASGAAAALSLTTGLSSILVGVMVAVALLPPVTSLGLMLGQGNTEAATGAALLVAINVVCINLASKLVFLCRGVRPRTGEEQERAHGTMAIYIGGWLIILALLLLALWARSSLFD